MRFKAKGNFSCSTHSYWKGAWVRSRASVLAKNHMGLCIKDLQESPVQLPLLRITRAHKTLLICSQEVKETFYLDSLHTGLIAPWLSALICVYIIIFKMWQNDNSWKRLSCIWAQGLGWVLAQPKNTEILWVLETQCTKWAGDKIKLNTLLTFLPCCCLKDKQTPNFSTPCTVWSYIPSHSPSSYFLQNYLFHTVTVTPSFSLLRREAEMPNIHPKQ